MHQPRHADRFRVSPLPAHITEARVLLRYTADFAAQAREAGMAERVGTALQHLFNLASIGFAAAAGFRGAVQPMPGGIVVSLAGVPLPPALIIMATRVAVGLHDADPAGLARLQAALDDDRAQAQALWGGVDFASAIAAVEISATGHGPEIAFDPFLIAPGDDALTQTEFHVFPGLAHALPMAPDIEDAILMAAAFGAFWPLGPQPDHALGEEEWFAQGHDLCVSDLSCETASLQMILAFLQGLAQANGGQT
jgi:hypothetical protein